MNVKTCLFGGTKMRPEHLSDQRAVTNKNRTRAVGKKMVGGQDKDGVEINHQKQKESTRSQVHVHATVLGGKPTVTSKPTVTMSVWFRTAPPPQQHRHRTPPGASVAPAPHTRRPFPCRSCISLHTSEGRGG